MGDDVFMIISAPRVLLLLGRQPRIVEAILTSSRTLAFEIAKELMPEEVEDRRHGTDRRRRPYIPRGPDEQWHVDAHCKLERYGFEIYGIMDAFSRMMILSYTGVSARTAVSCLVQYLRILERGRLPRFVRSDRGKETVLLANAHWLLRRHDHPDVPFKEVYRYGTSKSNQRIEAWWGQLIRGCTRDYVVIRLQNGLDISCRTLHTTDVK